MFNKTHAIIAQYFNFQWHEIPLEIEILGDTSSYTGDRQIQLKISDEFFQGDDLKHAYKPQKNDILMFGYFSKDYHELKWTKSILSYLFDDSTVQPAPLFLTSWTDDNVLTFKPLVCLDEEYWTDYGFTNEQLDLFLGISEVWNRLTRGEPHLRQIPGNRGELDKYIQIAPIVRGIGNNKSNGPKKLSDIWKNWVAKQGENIDLVVTYRPTGDLVLSIEAYQKGSLNNSFSYYLIDLREYEVSNYTERSRNVSETPNIFKVYTESQNPKDKAFTETTWLVRNGKPMALKNSVSRGSRSPIMKYLKRDNNENADRKADKLQVLSSSVVDDRYIDHDYSMSINIGMAWDWFGRDGINSTNRLTFPLIPYLNAWVRLTPDGVHVIRGKVREYDLLNGIMIVGTNSDYTFEGGNH